MSAIHLSCLDGHTPDHIPTFHGETGHCKVCLEYDYIAETQGINISQGVVVRPARWTPSPASEIEARRRRAGMLPVVPTAPQLATPVQTGNLLKLSGDVWEVRFEEGNESGNFKDRANSFLRHLARLLDEPNRRVAALEFYPPPSGAAPLPLLGRDESSDDLARKDYEKEMRRLAQEIKEADDAHDSEEAARLRQEFEKVKEHLDGETSARRLGHKKRCGTPSPEEKADQNLRVGLGRCKEQFRSKGLPKLADHLDKYLDNGNCEWWYAPLPDTSPWHVTRPDPRPEK